MNRLDLNQYLTPHFRLFEFVVSEIASRRGISNIPTQIQVNNLKRLCETILEPARLVLGPLRILSGFRSNVLNLWVGGSSTSDHPNGHCADVLPLRASKIEFARWVSENCKFDQIILELGTVKEPDWIHVSSSPKNRGEILQKMLGVAYKPLDEVPS